MSVGVMLSDWVTTLWNRKKDRTGLFTTLNDTSTLNPRFSIEYVHDVKFRIQSLVIGGEGQKPNNFPPKSFWPGIYITNTKTPPLLWNRIITSK